MEPSTVPPVRPRSKLAALAAFLIGFAVAQSSQCPYCVDSYTQQALEQGLTMQHLGEAMHCAASLRAGITLAHGLVAHNIDKKVSM